jgi:curved DNA-binding protein CbpA
VSVALAAQLSISVALLLQAYRKMALVKHPDKNPDNPRAAEEFSALQKAYDLLLDKEARAALDGLLKWVLHA